jgi:hypothetical protein
MQGVIHSLIIAEFLRQTTDSYEQWETQSEVIVGNQSHPERS